MAFWGTQLERKDVKKTLAEAIENLNKSVAEAANSNALVTLITHKSDGQTRTKRDVGPTPSNSIDKHIDFSRLH
uniref:Uncharacterized protein n=1 Tax=Megaselia scalaris TaxID=36166 RepID=T1GV77_MEGSC